MPTPQARLFRRAAPIDVVHDRLVAIVDQAGETGVKTR